MSIVYSFFSETKRAEMLLTDQDTVYKVYIFVCICKRTLLLCWMFECCLAMQLVRYGYLGRCNAVLHTQLFPKAEKHTNLLKSIFLSCFRSHWVEETDILDYFCRKSQVDRTLESQFLLWISLLISLPNKR